MIRKKIGLSVLLLILGLSAKAQQATTASGGDASGSGGTVAYSVGQVGYTTDSGTTGVVSQGVQQVYEILTLAVNETANDILLELFPNPTGDILSLQVKNFSSEKLSYQLFDIQGKSLASGVVTSIETNIDMSAIPAATYFIHVTIGNKKVQSFKIIKN